MPEITEVEKLRGFLADEWAGRKVIKFSAPPESPNPKRYAGGEQEWRKFSQVVRSHRIIGVERFAKHLWIQLEQGHAWHVHLSSTGWFLPTRQDQMEKAGILHENFMHSISSRNIRVKVHLDDDTVWHYHDPRTWGKWRLRKGDAPEDSKIFESYGPDWLKQAALASVALVNHKVTSKVTLKEVLCDQNVTAGLGNYSTNVMICENVVVPSETKELG